MLEGRLYAILLQVFKWGRSRDIEPIRPVADPQVARREGGAPTHVEGMSTTPPREFVVVHGRWVHEWDPEDPQFWSEVGRPIARVNLLWSIFAEFLGFAVWQVWSVTVVLLPSAGFQLSAGEQFLLVSLPPLVGATLRIPYTFAVAVVGGRNWTVVSALLLLVPALLTGIVLSNPNTEFWILALTACSAGVGGGNFSSSMSNISFFYPEKSKGAALGLNAAGGNLGVAFAQLLVPVCIAVPGILGLGGPFSGLPLAGLLWIPLILVSAWGAAHYMHNLRGARNDVAGVVDALREPHMWVMSVVYVGTFGSFMGFSAVAPTLLGRQFPEFSSIHVAGIAVGLAFLGPLVGSLARPWGGRAADVMGGAHVTMACFLAMAGVTALIVVPGPTVGFVPYLMFFLLLFTLAGVANGSSFRMVPTVFRLVEQRDHRVSHGRRSAAALGLIGAVGAYGGFLIPQFLRLSSDWTGGFAAAFIFLAVAYLGFAALIWTVYLRPGGRFSHVRV